MGKTGVIGAKSQRAAQRASRPSGGAASGEAFAGHQALSKEQVEAVGFYQEGSHAIINRFLRTGAPALPNVTRRTMERLGQAINLSRTTRPVSVFRGVDLGRAINPASLVGQTFRDPAFLSTSTNRRIAGGFAFSPQSSVFLKIKLPAGAKALHAYKVRTGSEFGEGGASPEFEVLLPRNTSFRITAARRSRKGTIIAIAEMLP